VGTRLLEELLILLEFRNKTPVMIAERKIIPTTIPTIAVQKQTGENYRFLIA